MPGESSKEGLVLTILAPEDQETFELAPEEEKALLAAIAESDRREVIPAAELLPGLGRGD